MGYNYGYSPFTKWDDPPSTTTYRYIPYFFRIWETPRLAGADDRGDGACHPQARRHRPEARAQGPVGPVSGTPGEWR